MKQVALLAMALTIGGVWQAQADEPDAGYGAQVVRCESRQPGHTYCPMDTARGVQLVRQLSTKDCIREVGWGVDERGLWTALGCRAEFAAPPAQANGRVVRRVVRCESKGRPETCPVSLQGAPVRLLRQLTAIACHEGTSWGTKRNQIWVSRGCSGEFEVGAADGSGFVEVPRSVTCESKKKLRRDCGVTIVRSVRLSKQLSNSACVLGHSWGWSRNGVWVSDGCRAQFTAE